MHRRQSSMNFSNMGPSHELQFFMKCSSISHFHEVQSFRNRQCGSPVGSQVLPEELFQRGLLSMGPQVLPGTCSGVWSPWGHSLLEGTTTCSGIVSSTGCRVDICPTVDLYGLPGDNLFHHGLHHRLQWNLCSGAWSTSSPSFFTDLCVCRVVCLTPLSWLLLCSIFLNMLSERCYYCH